jgi:hypothetical protein
MEDCKEYEIYYDPGCSYTLLSYPLLADQGHLTLARTQYQPVQRRLEQEFTAALRQDPEGEHRITYESRLLDNAARMVHSRLDAATQSFVWTSVDHSLYMYPKFQSRVREEQTDLQRGKEELEELIRKKDVHRYVEAKMRSHEFMRQARQAEPPIDYAVLPQDPSALRDKFTRPIQTPRSLSLDSYRALFK